MSYYDHATHIALQLGSWRAPQTSELRTAEQRARANDEADAERQACLDEANYPRNAHNPDLVFAK